MPHDYFDPEPLHEDMPAARWLPRLDGKPMQPLDKFREPKIIDCSETMPGQHPLPGMEHMQGSPTEPLTKDHPLYHQWRNPHVWGALAHPAAHNPFMFHHDFTHNDGEEMPNGLRSKFQEVISDGSPEDDENIRSMGHDPVHEGKIRAAERKLQKHIDTTHPCVAVTGDALRGILKDGRLKNQFETNTSRGSLSHGMRAIHEEGVYGYPSGHHADDYWRHEMRGEEQPEPQPPHARPIYGYLAKDTVGNTAANQYGSHTLVLKKNHLWHRTTAAMDDTLAREDAMRAQPVQAMNIHAYNPDSNMEVNWGQPEAQQLRTHLQGVANHHVDHPRVHSRYTEAQYHGGVTTNDIHYAVLRGGHFDPHLPHIKAALDEHKIPWVHVHGGTDKDVIDHNFHEAMLRRALHYQATLVAAQEGTMSAPKVVATRGDGIYLLELADGQGQVADTRRGLLFEPMNLQSILAHGYWEEPEHPVDAADILALVKPQ